MTTSGGTTHQFGNLGVLPVARIALAVAEGPDTGARVEISATARIGKSSGCQLKLTDTTVSRLQCEIRLNGQGARIIDLDSTNGTFVDGVRVYEAELAQGSVIRMGKTALRVEVDARPLLLPLSARESFGALVGASAEMRAVYAVMERVAPSEVTVLIQGETGTGKELVARAIHESSARAKGPFVAVDCGAIAESLMEAELFGHTRGAFTGAQGERRGLALEADGGTLFLDEIGELPLRLQPKLLRLLEQREVRAVGSDRARRVDVRVVAATNRALPERVNSGAFREDLYFRLAVVEIWMPPLRARRSDIGPLARAFWARFAGENTPFPEALMAELMSRSWPGNVRELRNFVERAVALGFPMPEGAGASAAAPEFDGLLTTDLPLTEAKRRFLDRFEQLYIEAVLRRTGGNMTRAAEIAGVDRRSLQRMRARLGLRDSDE